MLDERIVQLAKKRIWDRLYAKLPERGVSVYQPVLALLRSSEKGSISSLKKAQYKERILDLLPERLLPVSLFTRLFTRRVWAASVLVFFLAVFFLPVFRFMPQVAAASANVLEVVEGELWVNGNLISDTALIQDGDSIRSGEGSLAHLYFLDDSRLTLGPNTQVDIVNTNIHPDNRAQTQVRVRQTNGRVWGQILNLVSKESAFVLEFPQGELLVDSRASFDVQISDGETSEEARISVARNLINITVSGEAAAYEGILGQGASLLVGETVEMEEIPIEVEEDVWWDFNLAYGKAYARKLDESYKKEAIDRAVILPGHPLYFLKTFRETLQVSLAFSNKAKENLLVEQAESRLNEAQVLLTQGETEAAEEVLTIYDETVEEALENSDNEDLLAVLEETQKEVSVMQDVDENLAILEEHLVSSSALVPSDASEKAEVKSLSASQKLQRVPDLIADGAYNQALADLSTYQEESLSLLAELEKVPLEEREAVVSSLLDQKLKDIQILRVLASMPELSELVNVDATIFEQLSLMVLSLRERELGQLSAFFEATDYDAKLQYEIYNRLKDHVEITEELTEQFDTVEEELGSAQTAEVVMELSPVEVEEPLVPSVDPRFVD